MIAHVISKVEGEAVARTNWILLFDVPLCYNMNIDRQ